MDCSVNVGAGAPTNLVSTLFGLAASAQPANENDATKASAAEDVHERLARIELRLGDCAEGMASV
jgi:hypothetical protein